MNESAFPLTIYNKNLSKQYEEQKQKIRTVMETLRWSELDDFSRFMCEVGDLVHPKTEIFTISNVLNTTIKLHVIVRRLNKIAACGNASYAKELPFVLQKKTNCDWKDTNGTVHLSFLSELWTFSLDCDCDHSHKEQCLDNRTSLKTFQLTQVLKLKHLSISKYLSFQ